MFDRAAYRSEYPFESRWLDLDGIKMHYLDEGRPDRPPLVMVHGNPTWSFYYRELAKAFSPEHRVIVPDHIGMGLSDKPGDDRYSYRLDRRVEDLDRLLKHCNVGHDVTLVLHDWGGMIGLAWAARNALRVKRLVLFNTAAFRLPAARRLPPALKLARQTAVGDFLVRRLNAFARAAACVGAKERPLSGRIADAFCAPYDTYDNRIATLRFVQDIPLKESDPSMKTVRETEESLLLFRNTPTLICWGALDFVFDDHFLAEWRRILPQAEINRFPAAGHYVIEDEAELIIPLMRKFLAAHPVR